MRLITNDELEVFRQFNDGEPFEQAKITCCRCPQNEECKAAFDPYNVFGDCLMEK